MIRKILWGLLLVVAAGLGFGFYAYHQGAAIPGRSLPPIPAALSPAIDAGDSVTVADFARTRCRLLQGRARRACYEDLLLQLVERDKIGLSMGTLDLMGQREAAIRHYGHDYSHVVGINAWAPGENLGEVYLQCTELFQSGCYHGVIQAFLAYQGTDSAVVASICRDTPGIRESGWLRFQCVHGIGHGLLQTYTMDLPRALHGCDKLGNYFDTESCYGGAFMEFVVGGRGQSHHPHLKVPPKDTAAMDHAAMNHEAAERTAPFKVRSPGDLLYPCSVLGDRYLRACYQNQAGLMVEQTGLDFAKVAAGCDTAPEPMRPTFYQGIGTYASVVTTRNAGEAIRLCSLGNIRYQAWCFVGVVKNFIDVTANPDDGLAFCRMLGPREFATACYHAVGEQASVLYVPMEKRDTVCMRVEPKYTPACRFGAGLSQNRPEALPRR
jgi:hypothetical protein